MRHCRQCNLAVNNGVKYCPRCGASLSAQYRISIRGIVMVIVLFFILFAVLRSGGNKETMQTQALPTASDARSQTQQTSVATCQAMRRNVQDWTKERQEAYRRAGCWERVEAENGAAYMIDLGLIQSFGAGATTSIYNDEGGTFNVMNLKRWYFTCDGHFSVMENYGSGPTVYAPPHSVAAHMSNIVCAGAGK
jgi:hypothetical protein